MDSEQIDSLLRDFGVDPESFETSDDVPDARPVDVCERLRELEERDDLESAEALRDYAHVTGKGRSKVFEFAESQDRDIQDEIGEPGTKMFDGRLKVEPSSNYRPANVRGSYGNPGLLEEYYRQEPIARDAVDSTVQVQLGAQRSVKPPKEEHFEDESLYEGVAEFSKALDAMWRNLIGGFDKYVEHATQSAALFGFAPFEVVWSEGQDDRLGTKAVRKLAYREVSTVKRWVMNEGMDALVAVDFEPGGQSSAYTLPADGSELDDKRFALCRVSGRGNNWEGVAPGRASLHWWKFKKLLGQVAAATAEKFGVPREYIKLDADLIKVINEATQGAGGTPDDDQLDELLDTLDRARAVEAPVVELPNGTTVDMVSPQGQAPSFIELFKYCDEMMAKPFSNEGSLLGHNQVGSYALAQVQDNKFVRSAPAWDRVIMEPINRLNRRITEARFGRVPAYPKMSMRLDTLHNTNELLDDLTSLANETPVWEWPEDMQSLASEQLDADEHTFRREEDEVDEAPDDAQDDEGDDEPDGTIETTERELAEGQSRLESFNAQEAERFMDAEEERLAKELNQIAEEQRKAFRDATAGVVAVAMLSTIGDRVKEQFLPRYRRAVEESAEKLVRKGGIELIREFDVDIPDVGAVDLPALRPRVRQDLEADIDEVASVVNDRNVGWMISQRRRRNASPEDRSVQKIRKSTVAGEAAKIGGPAFNAGRENTMREACERADQRTEGALNSGTNPRGDKKFKDVRVYRSSMLDKSVCPACLSLDFEQGGPTHVFGSSAYYQHRPPLPCHAGPRCRCVYIHEAPAEVIDEMSAMARPKRDMVVRQ